MPSTVELTEFWIEARHEKVLSLGLLKILSICNTQEKLQWVGCAIVILGEEWEKVVGKEI